MADTVTVASKIHTNIAITKPMPAPTPVPVGMPPAPLSPEALEPRPSVVLNGASHPSAVGGEAMTYGVNAEVFRAWHAAMTEAGDIMATLVREVEGEAEEVEDEAAAEAAKYGFEPGIEAMTKANEGAEEEGSTVTHSGPVTSDEMDAKSTNPVGLENVPPDEIPNTVETTHPDMEEGKVQAAGSEPAHVSELEPPVEHSLTDPGHPVI